MASHTAAAGSQLKATHKPTHTHMGYSRIFLLPVPPLNHFSLPRSAAGTSSAHQLVATFDRSSETRQKLFSHLLPSETPCTQTPTVGRNNTHVCHPETIPPEQQNWFQKAAAKRENGERATNDRDYDARL
uniref:(northern house mosquito) hypothetical protein n=1 Tax=Culex pipiens TaxID=7175 RepID=A0A8D8FC28_CULPI